VSFGFASSGWCVPRSSPLVSVWFGENCHNRRARFLVRCSFVASGVVVFLVVRVGLVSVWLSGWSRPRCLLWRWPWGLFPSLLTIQGGRLSCRLYGFAGLFGGCPVWVWFPLPLCLRRLRVVVYRLPICLLCGWWWWCLGSLYAWIVGRGVWVSVVSSPFRIAPATVSIVGVWSGCASCGRVWSGCGVWVSGVVLYCTRRKILHFAPVFKL
jgi:hypothetical protein